MKPENRNSSNKMVTGVFDDKESAERAYRTAIEHGYAMDEINVMMSEDTRKKYYHSGFVRKELGDKSMEGLALGGALGGVIVGTLWAIYAIGSIAVFPAMGLILDGSIVAGFAGAGIGAIIGGLIGALVGWGIPEDSVKLYEKEMKLGRILLGVNYRDDLQAASLEDSWKNRHHETV